MLVSIDGAEPVNCPANAVDLSAGRHELSAQHGGKTTTAQIDINGLETTRLALTITPPVVTKAPVAAPAARPSADSGTAWLGWTLATAGVLTLGAGAYVDIGLLLPAIDDVKKNRFAASRADYDASLRDAEALQTITWVLYGSGVALLGAGVVALLLDSPEDAPVEAFIVPSGGGLQWRATF